MNKTTRESVKNLCKSVVTRLENRKAIELNAELRQRVHDEVESLIGPHVLTDEDLRNQTLVRLGFRADDVVDPSFFEGEQFRAARRLVRQTFGDDELNGFYFQKTLKTVAEMIIDYFMKSKHIDEVYESDKELSILIVDIVKRFRPDQVH